MGPPGSKVTVVGECDSPATECRQPEASWVRAAFSRVSSPGQNEVICKALALHFLHTTPLFFRACGHLYHTA